MEHITIAAVIILYILQGVIWFDLHRSINMAMRELRQAIKHSISVQELAIKHIKDLADQLANAGSNPDKEQMKRLADKLRAQADALSKAMEQLDEETEEEAPNEGEP
jgi:methyl-accepting chemotaxis protein